MTTKYVLGIDIGGTKIAVCVADEKGSILAANRLHGGAKREYREVLPELVELARRTVTEAELSMDDVAVVGLSCPGPLNIHKGTIEYSPNMVWEGVSLRDDIAAELGIFTVMENDANGGALAEWYFGAAQGYRNFIYFTMSTGIGGGIVAEGKLLEGASGNAGEVGHTVLDINGPVCGCGLHGCFEAFCGGQNVAVRLQKMVENQPRHPLLGIPGVDGDPENLRYETLRTGVNKGIKEAEELWDELCLRFAQGVGGHMMTFNPELIILGTTFYYSGNVLLEPFKKYLPRFCWQQIIDECEIKLPQLGSSIGELSGIATGLYGLAREQ
ncbi:MAG: ROK family protein [Verrucomicrobiota bacterium]